MAVTNPSKACALANWENEGGSLPSPPRERRERREREHAPEERRLEERKTSDARVDNKQDADGAR